MKNQREQRGFLQSTIGITTIIWDEMPIESLLVMTPRRVRSVFLGNPKMAELQLGTIDNVSPCLFVFFFRSGFEFESRGTHKKNKYMMVSK